MMRMPGFKSRVVIAVSCVIVFSLALLANNVERPVPERVVKKTMDLGRSLSPGWNLGNQLDALRNGISIETGYGNPLTTQAFFDSIKAAGIKSVRIPVTWIGHIGNAPDYKIDPDFLHRVQEVVGYAEKAKLNVILNIHHDGRKTAKGSWLLLDEAVKDSIKAKQIEAQFVAMWKQIARAFKNKGDFLIFEPFNEVHDGNWGRGLKNDDPQFDIVNRWNQLFVDAVRSSGGKNKKRYLAVVGYGTMYERTIDCLKLPKDKVKDRLIVSIHYYRPLEFVLEATENQWGHTRTVNLKDKKYDEEYLIQALDKIKKAFIDKGIPVYIGEYGCVYHANPEGEEFRRYYLEYFTKAAYDRGIATFVWDNNATLKPGKEIHAFFKHDTGEKVPGASEMIEAVVRACTCAKPSYTLESVYNTAPLVK